MKNTKKTCKPNNRDLNSTYISDIDNFLPRAIVTSFLLSSIRDLNFRVFLSVFHLTFFPSKVFWCYHAQVNVLFPPESTICSCSVRNRSILRKILKNPANFLVWKFCRNAQLPLSFGWFISNSAETVRFHKIYTSGKVKLRYSVQCNFFYRMHLSNCSSLLCISCFQFQKTHLKAKKSMTEGWKKKWCPLAIYRNIIFQYLKKKWCPWAIYRNITFQYLCKI